MLDEVARRVSIVLANPRVLTGQVDELCLVVAKVGAELVQGGSFSRRGSTRVGLTGQVALDVSDVGILALKESIPQVPPVPGQDFELDSQAPGSVDRREFAVDPEQIPAGAYDPAGLLK